MAAQHPVSECTPVNPFQLHQVGHLSGLNLFISNLTRNIFEPSNVHI